MADVLQALKAIQENQAKMAAEVESVSHRLDSLAPPASSPTLQEKTSLGGSLPAESVLPQAALPAPAKEESSSAKTEAEKSGFTSRIILT